MISVLVYFLFVLDCWKVPEAIKVSHRWLRVSKMSHIHVSLILLPINLDFLILVYHLNPLLHPRLDSTYKISLTIEPGPGPDWTSGGRSIQMLYLHQSSHTMLVVDVPAVSSQCNRASQCSSVEKERMKSACLYFKFSPRPRFSLQSKGSIFAHNWWSNFDLHLTRRPDLQVRSILSYGPHESSPPLSVSHSASPAVPQWKGHGASPLWVSKY